CISTFSTRSSRRRALKKPPLPSPPRIFFQCPPNSARSPDPPDGILAPAVLRWAVMIPRRTTRQIHVGSVAVGGGAPVTVQSMTTTKTADVDGTLAQIYALSGAGADIVRCTCNEEEAAEGLARIVPRSPVPLIADIHFQ